MSHQYHSVMVCDSGIGGLSICRDLLQLMPDLHLTYLADYQGFPYGTRTEQSLRDRVLSVVTPQLQNARRSNMPLPEALVVACNTASTLLLPDLRAKLNIPVVGVVPAIKPAAERTQTGTIGLLATPATITRPYIDRLIADFASHCDIIRVGSSRLVELAEDFLFDKPVSQDEVTEIISPFLESGTVDQVVLGCTHFPLLIKPLSQAWNNACRKQVYWVDSGKAIARRVQSLISVKEACSVPGSSLFLYTEQEHNERKNDSVLYSALQRAGLNRIRFQQVSAEENG